MTKLDEGGLIILTPPLNSNLKNWWALVTKTIGHPLHQLKYSNCSKNKVLGKTHKGKKSPPLIKQVESGLKFEKLANMLLQSSSL